MKKTILFILLAFSLTTKAQVVDSTITSIVACKIVPVKAQYTDSLNSTHLGVRVIADDLKTSATLYWVLLMENGVTSIQGNYTISGQEYADWCNNSTSCNLWPFVVVARKYNLTFKND